MMKADVHKFKNQPFGLKEELLSKLMLRKWTRIYGKKAVASAWRMALSYLNEHHIRIARAVLGMVLVPTVDPRMAADALCPLGEIGDVLSLPSHLPLWMYTIVARAEHLPQSVGRVPAPE